MTKRLVFLLTVFLFSSNLFSQLYEVGFDEKIRNSSFIVEGEVVKSESYYGKDNEIYTANELLVYKTFKGNNVPERLTIITLGGTVDSETETWTHLLKLSAGDAGIFFLEETKRPTPTRFGFPQHYFDVFASSQGFLKYHFGDGQVSAAAPFAYYPNIIGGLYKSLRQELGIPAIYLSPEWEKAEKCIVYLFEVSQPDPRSPLELEALVSIKSTQGQFYLYKSSVIAEFNSDALGESIIENEILEIENTGITDSEGYSVNAADVTPSKVKIEVVSNTSEVDEMALIGESYSALVKLKLNLPGLVDPGILLDESQMVHNSEYFDPESEKPEEFECIKIEGDFDIKEVCSPPMITSFSPTTISAGTDDTLTIRGMCFDSIRGTSEVEFTDSKAGAPPVTWVQPLDGEYILWSDTLIKVIVPSIVKGMDIKQSAGTGRFRVNRGGAGIAISPLDLNIPFAALNFATGPFSNPQSKGIPISLSNYNMSGGQSIYYAFNFKADTNAVKAFERALINWKCATFVNYKVQDSTMVPNINRAGRI